MNTFQDRSPLANILIVDDTPNNLRLLSTMLTDKGYKVRKAINGERALKAVRGMTPDLVLLDIMMPDMDGYDVCRRLKNSPDTRNIPVIFISALDDEMDKVLAFDVGGVDYIPKPFQIQEVLARVENHLTLRRQQKQLEAQNARLQQEIKDRQKAEDALHIYLHAVSHDLRNPVTGMSMVLNNLLKNRQDDTIAVPASILERMASSCDRQLNLINSLLETHELEVWGVPLACQPLNLYSLTRKLVAEWQPMLDKNQATLENLISANLPLVNADINQLWRVFENLIANSLKYNPPGVKLTLAAEAIETSAPKRSNPQSKIETIRCTFSDDGVGIESSECESLFERYRRGSSARRTQGLGLGLYLCRQIIEAHGGEIGAIGNLNSGVTFWFTLPVDLL